MKTKSILSGVLWTTVLVGLGIALAVQHQARLRLSEEHAGLGKQMQQLADLNARNLELSNLLAQANARGSMPEDQLWELLRLRGQVGVLRQQAGDLENAKAENRQAHAALDDSLKNRGTGETNNVATADYWPRGSWTFAGYATPDAALQTSIWASDNGNLKDLIAGSTGEMQKMLEQQFAGKSDDEASIRAMDEVAGLQSVQVLNRDVQSDNTVVITAEFDQSGNTFTGKLLLQKVGNDWKLAGPGK